LACKPVLAIFGLYALVCSLRADGVGERSVDFVLSVMGFPEGVCRNVRFFSCRPIVLGVCLARIELLAGELVGCVPLGFMLFFSYSLARPLDDVVAIESTRP